MKRASRTSHGEGPGSVPELQKKNFQTHEQRLKKKKRDMQVTADLLFREQAMRMIFSFLYIVFCKRSKRLYSTASGRWEFLFIYGLSRAGEKIFC